MRLTFADHIAQVTKFASRLLGFYARNWSNFTDSRTSKLMYVTFNRHKLEYTIIWDPVYRSLELVQKRKKLICLKIFI